MRCKMLRINRKIMTLRPKWSIVSVINCSVAPTPQTTKITIELRQAKRKRRDPRASAKKMRVKMLLLVLLKTETPKSQLNKMPKTKWIIE